MNNGHTILVTLLFASLRSLTLITVARLATAQTTHIQYGNNATSAWTLRTPTYPHLVKVTKMSRQGFVINEILNILLFKTIMHDTDRVQENLCVYVLATDNSSLTLVST